MFISPVKIFAQHTSFRGEKDETQPLSRAMRDIFADKRVSYDSKRTLWNLSEVPFFYEATKGMTRNDLLKLSDLFERQETNVLQMAIEGDVKYATDCGKEMKFKKYLSLEDVAKYNKTAPQEQQINLYDYILSHPIFKVERDAREQYKQYNVYPHSISYETVLDADGRPVVRILDMQEAFFKAYMTQQLKGKILDKNDVVIMFDKKIVGNFDIDTGYKKIRPESIEKPYLGEPESLKKIYNLSSQIPARIMRSLYNFGESDFFPNLVKDTNPIRLLQLAQFDSDHKYIVSKMFNEKITFDTINPDNLEHIHRPIIDIGRILKDIKEGAITESDFCEILINNTLVFEVCALYRKFKRAFPDKEPKKIVLRKNGDNFEQVVLTDDEGVYIRVMPGTDALAQAFLKKLDRVPYKSMILNFDPE